MASITTAATKMAHNPVRDFLSVFFNFFKSDKERNCKNTQIMDIYFPTSFFHASHRQNFTTFNVISTQPAKWTRKK